MEEGLQSPIQMAFGGKEGRREQWKECLWYWNNFTYIYTKHLEIYIDRGRSWCWGESKIVVLSCPVSVIYAGYLTTTWFWNLSQPSCLFHKQSKWALKKPNETRTHPKTTTKPKSCTKCREFCTSGDANVWDMLPDVYLEKVEAYSACLCTVFADFNFGNLCNSCFC